jgi:hypothetical protein
LEFKDSESIPWAGDEGCPVCSPGSAMNIKGHKAQSLASTC